MTPNAVSSDPAPTLSGSLSGYARSRLAGNRIALPAMALLAALATAARPATAQHVPAVPHAAPHGHHAALPHGAHVIVPPSGRSWSTANPSARPDVEISAVRVGVLIVQSVARTTMEIDLANRGARDAESVVLIPVPDGAAVSAFDFLGAGKEASAKLLPADQARAEYDRIVRSLRDPALLEYVGWNLIRSSVFPVPARGVQKVKLTWEHVLPVDGARTDYVLPRSEGLASAGVPWDVTVRLQLTKPAAAVYSPTHDVATERTPGSRTVTVKLRPSARTEPGPFRLCWLGGEAGAATATFFTYPDPKSGGGYFLLLAGLPADRGADKAAATLKREVTVVMDTSGSMAGAKMKQAKAAALQVLAGLEDGEFFNIIDFNTQIGTFADRPVAWTRESAKAAARHIVDLESAGGTNIHDALVEALRPAPAAGTLPIVLFLTDGLPTIRERNEATLRDVVGKVNTHKRRVFTFGVGFDVNAPFLTAVARETRATAGFVLPEEDVEEKVSAVFRRLGGPVLADPELTASAEGPALLHRRSSAIRDVQPRRLPDVFDGEQLVVLGRYRGEAPVRFTLTGTGAGGAKREFAFTMDPAKATTRNSFVPRLWAGRRIAELVDAVRQAGALPGTTPTDPRLKELTDEIVRLSTEFGILTEHTAFLALEGTDLNRRDHLISATGKNLENLAINTRSGAGAVAQQLNNEAQYGQVCLNRRNGQWDAGMNRVEIAAVQQVCDRTLYRRNGRWVDANAYSENKAAPVADKPDDVVDYGTPAFDRLLDRLVKEGRQGLLAVGGETLLRLDGRNCLVRFPPAETPAPAGK